jgi:hypothetical protein
MIHSLQIAACWAAPAALLLVYSKVDQWLIRRVRIIWVFELTMILVWELDSSWRAAWSYADCLYPDKETVKDWWDGTMPLPREALAEDQQHWEF